MSTSPPIPRDSLPARPTLTAIQAASTATPAVATAASIAAPPSATHLASEIRLPTKSNPTPLTSPSPRTHVLALFALWLLIYVTASFTPPLLDDADATHAQAAQAMLSTGDWVTLHVNGIRYLEKPPLPYWITAVSLKLFSPAHPPYRAAAFAVHFPLALTILALAFLGYAWARQAFNQTTALYTALFFLTSIGPFLFTRVFIPDALLSLLLALTLYAFLRSLHPSSPGAPFRRGSIADAWRAKAPSPATNFSWPYAMWTSLALAVLTKGLIAIVFILATALLFLAYTRQLHHWRRLKPLTGILLFLAIAAPWHILAGLRNTGGANGHGFFWFYFVNEHLLRFLGRRIPRDYNKLPTTLYWTLHLIWLFPWSLFAPTALLVAYRKRSTLFSRMSLSFNANKTFRNQTIQLLLIFSAFLLVFFSVSTNQEYYTFPVYLPLLLLLAAALDQATNPGAPHLASAMWASTAPNPPAEPLDPTLRRALTFTFTTYTLLGLAVAAALAYGLYASRHLPYLPDIGDLLAHRNVGDYTLSLSHFFDLTGSSFAALRLPAALAALAFLTGPAIAWLLYARRGVLPAVLAIAATSTVFLLAAHIAFVRFSPILSSANFARTIQTLERTHQVSPATEVLIFGDQAFGSSIPFYLDRHVKLVDGRTTSMLFGSTFPDAPPLFLTAADLLAQWGKGPRKLLFVPLEQRNAVDHLLGPNQIILQQTSGKALITDRPLNASF